MTQKNYSLTRRSFIRTTAAGAAAFAFAPIAACEPADSGSTFGGVHIGAITYSWRSMPSTAKDIINLSSILKKSNLIGFDHLIFYCRLFRKKVISN